MQVKALDQKSRNAVSPWVGCRLGLAHFYYSLEHMVKVNYTNTSVLADRWTRLIPSIYLSLVESDSRIKIRNFLNKLENFKQFSKVAQPERILQFQIQACC